MFHFPPRERIGEINKPQNNPNLQWVELNAGRTSLYDEINSPELTMNHLLEQLWGLVTSYSLTHSLTRPLTHSGVSSLPLGVA